jgi:hypothetical protein
MILLKIRDVRFIAVRRGGSLSDSDHHLLTIWAAKFAEYVLAHFEAVYQKNNRPRIAIDLTLTWARGEIRTNEAKRAA